MPEMDGIAACREITELLPDIKVLMLTASNEQDAIVRSIAAGATGYLQKYSSKEQLLTTLREVVQGEFRIPGTAARRLSRAVRSPSADAGSGAVGGPHESGAGDPEAVCPRAELPADRRNTGNQRLDRAQRGVGHTEEAGLQDQAADGGLGGAYRGWPTTSRRSFFRLGVDRLVPSGPVAVGYPLILPCFAFPVRGSSHDLLVIVVGTLRPDDGHQRNGSNVWRRYSGSFQRRSGADHHSDGGSRDGADVAAAWIIARL